MKIFLTTFMYSLRKENQSIYSHGCHRQRYSLQGSNKDLKVDGQVTTLNELWLVTLVILPVTIYDAKNVRILMF